MVNQIINLKTEDIQQYLNDKFDQMIEFLKQTHNGFYCSICDSEFYKYIDFEKQTITYSKNFVAKFMKNTMNFFLFKYVFLPEALELISNFLY